MTEHRSAVSGTRSAAHTGVLPLEGLDDGAVSRRGFLSTGAMALIAATLGGCGDTATGPRSSSPLPTGVTVTGRVITIPLASQPTLASTDGFLVIANSPTGAFAIVINLGSSSYKAFSSVCTHEGCIVAGFGSSRITCNCHGSQFNTSGQVVVGPAASALAQFTATFNAGLNTVTVNF